MSLRERLPLVHKNSKAHHLRESKEGDIVIVKENNLPRSNWKLGKIIHLVLGRDSKVQSAEILLPSRTVISRAINYLYPLELPTSGKFSEREVKYSKDEDLATTDENLDERPVSAKGDADNKQFDITKHS